jgi:hypothetical protein
MSFLGETFNVSDAPNGGGYDPLPAGWYEANITKADLNPTKDGTGQRINVRYDITGPTHQGRVVFGGLNIRNKSPRAEEIGRQQLGDICRCIGLSSIQDTDQLIGHPIRIKLKLDDDRNDVVGWKSMGGSAAPTVTTATVTTASSVGAAPPWAKK